MLRLTVLLIDLVSAEFTDSADGGRPQLSIIVVGRAAVALSGA